MKYSDTHQIQLTNIQVNGVGWLDTLKKKQTLREDLSEIFRFRQVC